MGDFEKRGLRLREQDLVGKVAVVTYVLPLIYGVSESDTLSSGASRGIGRAIAINLATRGCNVLGTCSSNESIGLIDEMAEDILKLYVPGFLDPRILLKPRILGLSANITLPDCSSAIADGLHRSFDGKVDILINNAAVTGGTKVGNTTSEKIQKMLFANLQTPMMLVDELVKRKMFRPESRIINISSDRARTTSNESLIYSATKAGLESLARTWAKVLGGNNDEYAFMAGTTANSISVGVTESDIVKRLTPEKREERLKEELPKQFVAPGGKPWFAQCEEVADVVGMLCSREARWITGSVIPANGGAVVIL
jgi:3-oxoacyl-[acyl-carrier protein] reductase